jgi:hypothetical protein
MAWIIDILSNWWTEIVSVLIGMVIVWLFGLFPPKYQFHKRINFAFKISKVVSKIDVSVETKEFVKISSVKAKLQGFLNNKHIEDINQQRDLKFNSTSSGGSYSISTSRDEETNQNFIVISCFNAFSIGLFGRIKSLKTSINELESILGSFSDIRKIEDRVIAHITLTPRGKDNSKERIKVDYSERNFSTTYTLKNIKVVNKGMSALKENIEGVFYEWMTSLM